MPKENYTIIKAQFPLVGGIAGHNLIVLKNSNGDVLGEMDGLATDKDGKIKPIGYKPSDKLIAYDFPNSYLYNESLPNVTLFDGDKKETLEKWQMGKLAVNKINDKNYGYPILGVGPGFGDQTTWAKNSNSVASTLIKAMELEEKNVKPHDGLTPGEGHLLLSEEEIKEIQEQVKPTSENASQGNSQSKTDGTRLAANKASILLAISTTPSINYTSHKKDSTAPYVLTQSLDNAQNPAKHTYFNGKPAYLLTYPNHPTHLPR